MDSDRNSRLTILDVVVLFPLVAAILIACAMAALRPRPTSVQWLPIEELKLERPPLQERQIVLISHYSNADPLTRLVHDWVTENCAQALNKRRITAYAVEQKSASVTQEYALKSAFPEYKHIPIGLGLVAVGKQRTAAFYTGKFQYVHEFEEWISLSLNPESR